jgi:UPF0755 protein
MEKRKKPNAKFAEDAALPGLPRIEDVVNLNDTGEAEPIKMIALPPIDALEADMDAGATAELEAQSEAATAVLPEPPVTLIPDSTSIFGGIESDAPFFAADAAASAAAAADSTRMMDALPVEVSQTSLAAPIFEESDEDAEIAQQMNRQALSEKKRRAQRRRAKRQREHVRTLSHIVGSLLLVVFIVGTSAYMANYVIRGFIDFMGLNTTEFSFEIEIPPDASTEEIAELLYQFDIISMPGLFVRYARLSGKDGDFLNGLFNFNSTMSYSQIIHTLQNRPRSTETVMVTIPEGMSAREIGELLEESGVCRAEDFMEFYRTRMGRFDFELRLEHEPLKFNQMEGFLFPDTYEFFVINGLDENPYMDTSANAETAARTMMRNFNANMTPEIYWRIGNLNTTLPFDFGLNELVTLASMVQWEAGNHEDMRLVASVFLNRLRAPDTFPQLQSDVTRRYANRNILPYRTHANAQQLDEIIAAFDTHSTNGLPPGPVTNPGMAAMLAVLDAPRSEYFYFCANLETRETFFARTYAEHQRNLRDAGLVDEHGNQIFQ